MRKIIHDFTLNNCKRCNRLIEWPNYSIKRASPITQKMYSKISYCSRRCRDASRKELMSGANSPGWRGGKPNCSDCGKRLSFYGGERCKPCWYKFHVGENHSLYKQELTNYKYIHAVLRKENGAPSKCTFCGAQEGLEWANKSGKYSRNIEDYIGLCTRCHRQYDCKSPKWGKHLQHS